MMMKRPTSFRFNRPT